MPDEAKDQLIALQIRDQMWADLRTSIPMLDRLNRRFTLAAAAAERRSQSETVIRLTSHEAALVAQVLAMSQGELHLRALNTVT